MKQIICGMIAIVMVFALGGCGEQAGKENAVQNKTDQTNKTIVSDAAKPQNGVDPGSAGVDLTKLSSTMVYAEVNNMMQAPDQYIGKTITMQGTFAVQQDEATGNMYYACIIADAAACCAQGIEFVRKGEHTYPDDYPQPDNQITVVGTFDVYEEGEYRYCRLIDAELSV